MSPIARVESWLGDLRIERRVAEGDGGAAADVRVLVHTSLGEGSDTNLLTRTKTIAISPYLSNLLDAGLQRPSSLPLRRPVGRPFYSPPKLIEEEASIDLYQKFRI